ncbi:MAG: RraA family protein [Candidatus Bathyarchaeota archaeon]|nr:RraA family protein [Candidatus Bathyarchaeota archaeon]
MVTNVIEMEWLDELKKKALDIKRPPKELIEEIKKLDASLMYDGLRYQFGIHTFLRGIKPMFNFMRGNVYVGPAITVHMRLTNDEPPGKLIEEVQRTGRSREDARLTAIDYAKPGDILVMGAPALPEGLCPWGECFSTFAKRNEIQTVVINGGVRDTYGIEKMKLPVFAKWSSPAGAYEFVEDVDLNVPIQCGGVQVKPGDLIMGDGDGVIVIPADYAKETLEYAKKKAEKEKYAMEVLAPSGKPALESLPPGRPRKP